METFVASSSLQSTPIAPKKPYRSYDFLPVFFMAWVHVLCLGALWVFTALEGPYHTSYLQGVKQPMIGSVPRIWFFFIGATLLLRAYFLVGSFRLKTRAVIGYVGTFLLWSLFSFLGHNFDEYFFLSGLVITVCLIRSFVYSVRGAH